jgi:hypothetical protein
MNDCSWHLIVIGISFMLLLSWYLLVPEKVSEGFLTQNVQIKNNQLDKITVYKQKVENKDENKVKVPTIIEKDKKLRELYELYYKGIPDTYDINGVKIPGVEPNSEIAIDYLNQIINSSLGTEKDMLQLAKIYHQGMHKFEPQLDVAKDIYNQVKTDPRVNEETWYEITEGVKDIDKIKAHLWLNLPLPGQNSRDEELRASELRALELRTEALNLNDIIQRRIAQQRDDEDVDQYLDWETHDENKTHDDPQNTHNSQVLSTIRHSLDLIRNSTNITKSPETSIKETRDFINSLPDSDKKKDALASLDYMVSKNEVMTNVDNITESDALSLVWNRINEPNRFDSEISKNLKETMTEELASMQEYGTTVCATGRLTRIVDTLNGVDEDVSIKPTYAIKEEMLNKSAKIRGDLLNKNDKRERELLEKGGSANQETFDENLKKTIIDELKKDYVETKILTPEKFNTEINGWIDYI